MGASQEEQAIPATAHRPRLLVIGLDGADPRLVFDRLIGELPCLRALTAAGEHGPLASTDPPVTVPAWISMFTGRDPGELGLYGFRNRSDRGTCALRLASARDTAEPRVWDRLSERGLTSYLLGVPGTYPPWPIRGRMVASFLAPSTSADFVWPRSYRDTLLALAPDYALDAEDFRTTDKAALLGRIEAMTRARFRVARAWAQEPNWDLMVVVEMGTDRMHHAFWRHFDPDHPRHVTDSPWARAIPDYYRTLDGHLARLIAAAGPGVAVLIVSDHGAQPMRGGFLINEWLIRQGDLVLARRPQRPEALRAEHVDWARTRAWADGGHYARLWINLAGREPGGLVTRADYPAYRADLAARLEATEDQGGQRLGTRVLWPDRIYRLLGGQPPDLMAYLGDLGWRAIGQVGARTLWAPENDTGPDDANHAPDGIHIWSADALAAIRSGPGGDRVAIKASKRRSILEVSGQIMGFFDS